MKTNILSKVLSLILALAMCLPVSGAFAENDENIGVSETEEAFSVEVCATDEYKALFIDGYYTGDYVIAASSAPAYTSGTQNIASWDENGIAKHRTYTITVDGEAYAEGTTTVFKYSDAIAVKAEKEAAGSEVVLTESGYDYTASKFKTLYSSKFNTTGHKFGPMGSAFRNADFQIMTHREIAPGRVQKGAYTDAATTRKWLTTDTNYLYTVTPNAKATVYVAFSSTAANAKDHEQYIADGWTFIDSSSYFTEATLSSLPDEAVINGFETLHLSVSRTWYMVEPSYIIEKAPYSLVKVQYDNTGTQAQVYPYVWYKTVEAGETVKVPTVGDCVATSDQQPIKGFVIQGEHAVWEPAGSDATLKTLSYEIDGALKGEIAIEDDIYEYEVTVPSNADEIKLTAETNDEDAVASVADADLTAEEKKATVTVTAEDGITQKSYTVNVKTASVPFLNITSVDTFISEANTFKMYDAVEEGVAADKFTSDDAEERAAKGAEYTAKIKAVNDKYGTDAARGTSIWNRYPQVTDVSAKVDGVTTVTGVKLDNPVSFGTGAYDADYITDGDSWVFKSTKGATPTEENQYSFGKNDEYLTFDISKPGTMYVVMANEWGYKGGTDNGYTHVDGYTLGGYAVYEKHFEAGRVKVPAQDTDKYTIGTRQANTIGFVFMFDDASRAELKSITCNVGGSENIISYIDRDTTTFDISISDVYDGEVEVTADAVMEGTDVISSGTLNAGSGTITVTAKSPDKSTTKDYIINFTGPTVATITFATNGADIIASVDGGEEKSFGYNKTAKYIQGTKIKLTAAGGDGQEFMYWKEAASSSMASATIVSEDEEYSFTAGTNRNLVAVFSDKDAFTVSFRSNGRIVADATTVDKVPANPYIAGYIFDGWYFAGTRTDLKAGEDIPELEENTIYQAGFKKSDAKYTVTVYNGTETAQTIEKQYNNQVTLEAAEVTDKVFICWERDGAAVSYNKEYSFYVNADTTVKAVYSEEAIAAPDAVVILAKPAQITGELKLAYYAERNVAANLEVVETGILLDTDSDFDVNTAKIKAIAKSAANSGQYTIRKANVTPGEEWYGKAYVIYKKDGETKVAYSEMTGPDTTVAVE